MNARKILRAQSESHSGGGSAHRLPVIFASRGMRHSVRRLELPFASVCQLTYAWVQNTDQLNLGTRVSTTSGAGAGVSLRLTVPIAQVQITVDKTVDYATDDHPDSLSVTTDQKNRPAPSV
ncbi:hypothetical protein TRAPUB_6969 [Trametes pubescens]|uniref:Uncharacterized protein n=1 Tax=Trametes pubescens TaxID=154538 RepID=A0A1M2V4N3_TRAPU|nr:hypothetical protein TRAPUB_6969 [Trametes pubescens]